MSDWHRFEKEETWIDNALDTIVRRTPALLLIAAAYIGGGLALFFLLNEHLAQE
mgnify:CR=1 FL=1